MSRVTLNLVAPAWVLLAGQAAAQAEHEARVAPEESPFVQNPDPDDGFALKRMGLSACFNASDGFSLKRPRGPALLDDMDMKVTWFQHDGGSMQLVDNSMELYVRANLTKYLYEWDSIARQPVVEDSQIQTPNLNRFGCGPDTPIADGNACCETHRLQLPRDLGVNETVVLGLHVDVTQNPNATCVWSIDAIYPTVTNFVKRGRGLCSSLKQVGLPGMADAVKLEGTEWDPNILADISIIVHQYEPKKDNPCPVGEYSGSTMWDDYYPDYNQIGSPKQFFFRPGPPRVLKQP